jgi:hypothetical protein
VEITERTETTAPVIISWFRGFVVSRFRGFVVRGFVVSWFRGFAVSRFRGFVFSWFVVSWLHFSVMAVAARFAQQGA